MNYKLPFAFSPCPNDTFAFDALVHGKIPSSIQVEAHLFDIEKLNSLALEKTYPITKTSAFCVGKLTKDYVLLESGSAAGFGVGPKLIAKERFALDDLHDKTVAIPGKHTTANLLFHLLMKKPKNIIYMPYDQIVKALVTKECDAGVIIHETRFSYQTFGLYELQDLGALFQECYNLPIPLGVIVGKRSLGNKMLKEISYAIQQSVLFARQNPTSSLDFVLKNAQEKEASIIRQHIDLYVNEETLKISKKTLEALTLLFEVAIEQKLLDKSALNYFDEEIFT